MFRVLRDRGRNERRELKDSRKGPSEERSVRTLKKRELPWFVGS